jgi:hypothetical protein
VIPQAISTQDLARRNSSDPGLGCSTSFIAHHEDAMTKFALALVSLFVVAPLVHAQAPSSDPWTPLRFLVGEWQGAATGEQGTGTVTRHYRFILSGRYLQEQSMASFPPQPLQPDGAVLSNASFMVYDMDQKAMVFRQLHQEKFNGIFLLSASQSRPTKLIFDSVRLDSAPATWKARDIYEWISPNEYVETFEVAEGDKPFAVQSRIQFKRRQS